MYKKDAKIRLPWFVSYVAFEHPGSSVAIVSPTQSCQPVLSGQLCIVSCTPLSLTDGKHDVKDKSEKTRRTDANK